MNNDEIFATPIPTTIEHVAVLPMGLFQYYSAIARFADPSSEDDDERDEATLFYHSLLFY
jgi:hypothetical protein